MRCFLNFVLKKSTISGLLLLAIVSFFIYQIPDFQLDASSDSLVLENDVNLRYYKNIRKNYGNDNYLVVSYKANGDLFSLKQLQHLKSLRDEIKTINQVSSVTTILDVPLFRSPPLSLFELASKNISIENGNADLSLVKQEFINSPIYSNNLVSEDGNSSAILVNLKTNNEFSKLRQKLDTMRLKKVSNDLNEKQLTELKNIEKQVLINNSIANKTQAQTISKIRVVVNKYKDEAQLFIGGLPMITTDIIAYIGNDLIIFSLCIIAIMILILAFIFKSIRWVVIPITISIASALVMTGLLSFLGWKVTVISSNFFSLLLVMTLSVVIHLVVRYRELAQNNLELDNNTLIQSTLKQMFKPCLFTTLTTIAAFSSLLISGIKPVIDFGWMMSIGVSIAFVLSFLAFFILMSILPARKVSKHKTELSITGKLAIFSDKFGNHLIISLLVLVVVSGFGISKISVENRFIDYFKQSTEINQGLSFIDKNLGGTIPLEIVFDGVANDYWFDEDLRENIHKAHEYIDAIDATGKVLSIDTFMQILTEANNGDNINGFFLNIAKNRMSDSAKQQILYPYMAQDSDQARIVVRVKETNSNLKRAALIAQINNHLSNELGFDKNSFHLTGMLVLYNNMLQSLFSSQIKTIGVVFAIIFVMFLLIFKSFSLSIIALIPNTLPSIFILGIMGLFGIPLDLMTITIAAIAIGIGVDNAIHYIHRFKAEFKKDKDYLAIMYRSHDSIGLAMFYTAITVTLGFLVLTLSNFIPSIYFGMFTAIAMLSSVLANLTLLPKLILIFKPKIK